MRRRPLAVVMGDINLVRPLALAGVASALAGTVLSPARFSRHVEGVLPHIDPIEHPEDLADQLVRFALEQDEPPALAYQTDASLLFVSRHRERLAGSLRFPVASPELVEDLLDKERFSDLAARHDLPVPRTERIDRDDGSGLDPPLIVKPLMRSPLWEEISPDGKAVRVDTADELRRMRERTAELGLPALAQELIPGPESRVESYHAYIRSDGETLGEFTGRKIRTLPAEYGFSTSVEVTDIPDVRELGRDVFARIGLRGVAKADFKRAPDGSLKLLEINPRFNLWHYPGAVAGVNLPGIAVADVRGEPPAPARPARGSVTWCQPLHDIRAARESDVSLAQWARFAAGCDTYSSVSLTDPMPLLRGRLAASLGRAARSGLRR